MPPSSSPRYFVESRDPAVLRQLLSNSTIRQARINGPKEGPNQGSGQGKKKGKARAGSSSAGGGGGSSGGGLGDGNGGSITGGDDAIVIDSDSDGGGDGGEGQGSGDEPEQEYDWGFLMTNAPTEANGVSDLAKLCNVGKSIESLQVKSKTTYQRGEVILNTDECVQHHLGLYHLIIGARARANARQGEV